MKYTSLILFLLLASCKGTDNTNNELKISIKYPKGDDLIKTSKYSLSSDYLSEDFLSRQGTFKGAENLNTDGKKKDYLQNQAEQEALFLEAVSLGYFNDQEVLRNVKKIVVQKLMRDKLEKLEKEFNPTEDEIEKHYNEKLTLYKRGHEVKIAYVEVPTLADEKKAKIIANEILAKAKDKVKNGSITMWERLSKDFIAKYPAARITYGPSSLLEKESFDIKFGKGSFDAIEKLDRIGHIAPLLKSKDKYIVAMKLGERKALNETIEQARDKIIKRLSFESRGKIYDNFVKELMNKHDITIDMTKLSDLGKETVKVASEKK